MDGKPVPDHPVGQVGVQPLVLPALQEFSLGLVGGDEGDLGHVVHLPHPLHELLDLLLGEGLVHVDQELIFLLQLAQLLIHVDGQQGERAHDDEAGHDHAHRGKGHQAVGEDAHKALFDEIAQVEFSHAL